MGARFTGAVKRHTGQPKDKIGWACSYCGRFESDCICVQDDATASNPTAGDERCPHDVAILDRCFYCKREGTPPASDSGRGDSGADDDEQDATPTARPWQIASAFSIDPTEIYGPPDPKGRDFPKIIAGTFGDDSEATANAALIVQAVNGWEAMRRSIVELSALVEKADIPGGNYQKVQPLARAALALADPQQ